MKDDSISNSQSDCLVLVTHERVKAMVGLVGSQFRDCINACCPLGKRGEVMRSAVRLRSEVVTGRASTAKISRSLLYLS